MELYVGISSYTLRKYDRNFIFHYIETQVGLTSFSRTSWRQHFGTLVSHKLYAKHLIQKITSLPPNRQ